MAHGGASSTYTTVPRGAAGGVTLGQAAGRCPHPQQGLTPALTLPPHLVLAKAIWTPKARGGAQVSQFCPF